ncbi:MAG TPA: TIGR01906 family membrane protein [Anaerolineaceae bacterium]
MKRLIPVLSAIIIVVLPFFLIITAVRIMITPLYARLEYNSPGFPADPYGFTKEDRLYWSEFAINYLVNDSDITYLGDLYFPDGQPLYNARELSHMLDVKNLVQAAYRAWWVLLAVLAGLGIWAWLGGWWYGYRRALNRGGWATLGLIGFVLVAVTVSFSALFTQFHRLFFSGDTWIFEYSDTLIRLFPMRFWRDAFILVGALSISGALLCIFAGRRAQA